MSLGNLSRPPSSGPNLNLPKLPKLPKDVTDRFPSLKEWESEMEEFRKQLLIAMRGQAQ